MSEHLSLCPLRWGQASHSHSEPAGPRCTAAGVQLPSVALETAVMVSCLAHFLGCKN